MGLKQPKMRDPGCSVVEALSLSCGRGAAALGDPGGLSTGSEGSVRVGSCRVTIFQLELMLRFANVFARADTHGAKPELPDKAKMLEANLMLAIYAW